MGVQKTGTNVSDTSIIILAKIVQKSKLKARIRL